MNNELPKLSLEQIKKYITIATIALVSLCALLGIIMIFIGSNLTVLNVLWTLLIMYLVLVYSTNNITRLSDQLSIVRVLSCLALVANVFWSLLWILLVWDAFGGLTVDSRITLWKIVGSSAVISIFCTILSARVAKLYYLPTVVKFFKSLPLVCAGFLGIDILLVIWFEGMDETVIYKFILAELILLALQAIVSRILVSNATRLGINLSTPSNTPTASESSEEVKISDEEEPASTGQSTPVQNKYPVLTIIGIITLVIIGIMVVLPLLGSIISFLYYAAKGR